MDLSLSTSETRLLAQSIGPAITDLQSRYPDALCTLEIRPDHWEVYLYADLSAYRATHPVDGVIMDLKPMVEGHGGLHTTWPGTTEHQLRFLFPLL